MFKNELFYFVVAMGELVHDVEAIHGLCKLLTSNCNSLVALIFQKRFLVAVSS